MPLPEPKSGEAAKEFIDRCMGDEVMNREYPDAKQRYAVCRRLTDEKYDASYDEHYGIRREKFDLKTVDVGEIDIMGVGTWKGIEFNEQALKEVADNFSKLKDQVKVWLHLGHSGRLGTERRAGMPAVGWFDKVWYDDKVKKLKGHLTDVPKKLADLIRAKAYRTVSAEYIRNFEVLGNRYNRIIAGVGLLGSELPAVTTNRTLDQVRALYSDTDYEHEIVEWYVADGKISEPKGGDDVDEKALRDRIEELKSKVESAEGFIMKVCEKFSCDRDELLAKIGEVFTERDGLKAKADEAGKRVRTQKIDALFDSVSGKLLPKEEETYRTVLSSIDDGDALDAKIQEFSEMFTKRGFVDKHTEEKATSEEHNSASSDEKQTTGKTGKTDESFDANGLVDEIEHELKEKGLGPIDKEEREKFISQYEAE